MVRTEQGRDWVLVGKNENASLGTDKSEPQLIRSAPNAQPVGQGAGSAQVTHAHAAHAGRERRAEGGGHTLVSARDGPPPPSRALLTRRVLPACTGLCSGLDHFHRPQD